MNAPHEMPQRELRDPKDGSGEAPTVEQWTEANHRWLASRFRRLAALLDALSDGTALEAAEEDAGDAEPALTPALMHMANVFGLSPFEGDLLTLCAGVELDAQLRRSVQKAQGDSGATFATFGLALQALNSPHWDAVSPKSPLRRWRLIQVHGEAPLLESPLRIDERVLHHICGLPATDERLDGLVRYLGPSLGQPQPDARTRRITRWLVQKEEHTPLIVMESDAQHAAEARDEALCALGECGRHALWIAAHELPEDPRALARLAQSLDREALLTPAWPVVALDVAGEGDEALERRIATLLAHLTSPAVVTGTLGAVACASLPMRRVHRLPRRTGEEGSRELAAAGLSPALGDAVRKALQQFELGRGALQTAIDHAEAASNEPDDLTDAVWQACREQARGGLDALAQRVSGSTGFDDLVLPEPHLRVLREITEHLRQRDRVYLEWGMGGKSERGRGLCALFAGESGTGKTLAAEAIANEAGLDLYRVDLATVISKYIGETEKNLKRLFDAAHASGAVLLFDEADALFGKRSEVKDSHDRYANVEIAYLLQSIESYRGMAILTTNLKSAIDRAFLRRIRFVLQFPFPDAAARERIWHRQFPAVAPVGEIDYPALARAALPGGNIRNVALNAAFRAAGGESRITHELVVAALREEFAKLERSLGDVQLGGTA